MSMIKPEDLPKINTKRLLSIYRKHKSYKPQKWWIPDYAFRLVGLDHTESMQLIKAELDKREHIG